MSEERWQDIPGYDGVYQASDLGRVRSVRWPRQAGKILKPSRPKNPNNYPAVCLYKDGKKRLAGIHVLVLEAFVGRRPLPTHHARHLNGDCHDNRIENLAWGTAQENADDSVRLGAQAKGERHGMYGVRIVGEAASAAKLTNEQVNEIRRLAQNGFSLSAIARMLDQKLANIHRIVRRKTWTSLPDPTDAAVMSPMPPQRKEKPLVAYQVLEDGDGSGGIVFAKTNAHAARLGSAEFGDGEFDWGRASRLPWADAYVEQGYVPRRVMWAHGWWFTCDRCRAVVYEGPENAWDELTDEPLCEDHAWIATELREDW